ncbi:MAG TPA: hybrid sensor histidine kinase/response regulator, partial [Candidatus Kapabacteria bacterium]|nr:hybrid sensor histidine kinase/response regulator [Candidatus Kapabacteria bacterium]
GEAGLHLAESEKPDLILCDIQMPKMDGYGVLQGIRENKATASIPFIFLTGLGEKPKMRRGMESGADDYIVKPFTVQELIAAIQARLAKHATVTETAETRLNELRDSLTFALPHELVTPLNTILGFSSLLVESPQVSHDEIKEYAGLIQQAGTRLKSLVEKFMVFAQVELAARTPNDAGSRPPQPTKETISVAASRVAQEFQRANDLRLSLDTIEHPITSSHLERIVRELAENAFKFSEHATPVEMRSSRQDGKFVLTISDRGRGLTTEQIQRIGANVQFDRRLHEQQGSGLGLAIASRLVEQYGGHLRIQSQPGEQTTATVELPI